MRISGKKLSILVISAVILVSGAYIGLSTGGEEIKAINLDSEDDGSIVTVTKNTEAIIELPENPSTGYTWRFDLEGGFAELLDNEYIPLENQAVGNEGSRRIRLTIIGGGGFSARYVRPWENEIEDQFSVDFRTE